MLRKNKLIRNLTFRTGLNPLVDYYLTHLRSKWTLNPRIIPVAVQIPSISGFGRCPKYSWLLWELVLLKSYVIEANGRNIGMQLVFIRGKAVYQENHEMSPNVALTCAPYTTDQSFLH